MQIDKMGENKSKIKVYVDGANMFYAQKKLGWSFDWVKIKNKIEKNIPLFIMPLF